MDDERVDNVLAYAAPAAREPVPCAAVAAAVLGCVLTCGAVLFFACYLLMPKAVESLFRYRAERAMLAKILAAAWLVTSVLAVIAWRQSPRMRKAAIGIVLTSLLGVLVTIGYVSSNFN